MEFSLYEIFWYFVIYAVLGWVVEVCFCSIKTGSFVNRGFLNGPVCPIYGFGAIDLVRRGGYQPPVLHCRVGCTRAERTRRRGAHP